MSAALPPQPDPCVCGHAPAVHAHGPNRTCVYCGCARYAPSPACACGHPGVAHTRGGCTACPCEAFQNTTPTPIPAEPPRFVQIAIGSVAYRFGSELRETHTLVALDADGVVWCYGGLDKVESAACWMRFATARALPKDG